MPIEVDETWLPAFDGEAWRRVLRDGFVVGRIKRVQASGDGEITREWFSIERMIEGQYIPVEGTHATFEEAVGQIVMHSVMQ
ncbi:hypothetical protein [Methylobacterium sp. Gmos1]